MRLGIGSYTFTWAIGVPGHAPTLPMNAFGLLDEAIRLGVRVVQYCDNLPLGDLDARSLVMLHARASEARIAIELGTRGLDPGNLRAYLGLARGLGCDFLRVVIDRAGVEPTPEEAVAQLRLVLPEFEQAGVRIAIENHDRFSSRTLARIVEQLGPHRVGVCLDTVNSFGALEGPEVVVSTLAPYVLNLHIKDFNVERVSSAMGFEIRGCPAGRGRLNVAWILEQLRAAGRDPNAILELWTPYGPDLAATIAREAAWADESIGHLRRLIP